MPFLPLTLTLSPKGRGEITFDNTPGERGRTEDEYCPRGGDPGQPDCF